MPYGVADAERDLAEQRHLTDVTPGTWVQIAIEAHGEVVGDVAVGLPGEGRIAYLGYTIDPVHQGNGYASEAAAAIVDAIFERTDIHRVIATLDPENFASMRVIEPLGFRHEALAREAELVRGNWVDDARFALLRSDRAAWLARPTQPPVDVRLVEIEAGDAWSWSALETFVFQRRFVSPVAKSIADALVPPLVDGEPVVPWLRGVVADGERVGFVMVAQPTDSRPDPYLWRLLIDRAHQRRSIGSRVVRTLIDAYREAGCARLLLSYVEGPGGPGPLYRRLGFEPTGHIDEGEIVAAIDL